jgi:hypothetical protein
MRENDDQKPKATAAGNLVSSDAWLASLNKTRTTGWRWRKAGLIGTVNVFGKLYCSRDEIARFEQRAIAGEFHRDSTTPHRAMAV